jgi:hypothetical protein
MAGTLQIPQARRPKGGLRLPDFRLCSLITGRLPILGLLASQVFYALHVTFLLARDDNWNPLAGLD